MVDIFGPNTRLDPRSRRNTPERDIISAILPRNEVLFPLFSQIDNRVSLETHLLELESNKFTSNKSLKNISGGTIIPYDFIEIPTKDFITQVQNRKLQYRTNYKKFVARPDFLYVDTKSNENEAHIYPIDIKTGSQLEDIRQTSMYNTAMLYFHSTYMQTIVKHFKNKGLKVILENGFHIINNSNSNNTNSQSSKKLEDYIKMNLKNCIPNNLGENDHAGIEFTNGNLKLIINGESKFDSDLDYSVFPITENKMIEYFRFIKRRLANFTTYPNPILSFNGFFQNNKMINRLSFNPNHYIGIKTGNPSIEEIENEIEQIYAMNPKALIEKGPGIQLSTNERILNNLNRELKKKQISYFKYKIKELKNRTNITKNQKLIKKTIKNLPII